MRAADVAFPSLPASASPRALTAGVRGANRLVGTGRRRRARRCRCSCRRSTRTATSAPASGCRTWPCRSRPTPAGTSASRRSARPISCFRCWDRTWRFPRTRAERERAHDPRRSIEERYPSREQYLTLVQEAGAALVKDRYLLADDLAAHRQARRRALGSADAQGRRRRRGRAGITSRSVRPSGRTRDTVRLEVRTTRLRDFTAHRLPPAPRPRACRP